MFFGVLISLGVAACLALSADPIPPRPRIEQVKIFTRSEYVVAADAGTTLTRCVRAVEVEANAWLGKMDRTRSVVQDRKLDVAVAGGPAKVGHANGDYRGDSIFVSVTLTIFYEQLVSGTK